MFTSSCIALLSHWPLAAANCTNNAARIATTGIQHTRQVSYMSRWQAKSTLNNNLLTCPYVCSLKQFRSLNACYTNNSNSQTAQPNYYNILGVPSNATQVAIKKRYYKLCFEFHPDRLNAQHTTNKSTAETRESAIRTAKQKFQQISEAYRVIGHPARRREYDNRLLPASRRSGGGGAAAGQSGYSPFKRSRPSETERRRWQEATRPIYRTQSGDELRNRMWRRSNWLYEANQRNKNSNSDTSRTKTHTENRSFDPFNDRMAYNRVKTRFHGSTAQKVADELNYRINLQKEESVFLRRAIEVSILLTIPVLGATMMFGIMTHVYADDHE